VCFVPAALTFVSSDRLYASGGEYLTPRPNVPQLEQAAMDRKLSLLRCTKPPSFRGVTTLPRWSS
jgi:hypothetical protein